jgi:hypothetical protein
MIRKQIPIHFNEDEVGILTLVGTQGNTAIDAHFELGVSSRSILQHVVALWETIVTSLKELGITEVYTCVPCDLLDDKMIKFWGLMGFEDLRELEDHFYTSRSL